MKRRDFPKEIEVKEGVFYTVKFKRGMGNVRGLCCSVSKEITIATGLTPKERAETWIHELAHSLEFEWGIDIPHKLIYKLETPILELIKSNKPIWSLWKKV